MFGNSVGRQKICFIFILQYATVCPQILPVSFILFTFLLLSFNVFLLSVSHKICSRCLQVFLHYRYYYYYYEVLKLFIQIRCYYILPYFPSKKPGLLACLGQLSCGEINGTIVIYKLLRICPCLFEQQLFYIHKHIGIKVC